MYLLPFLFIALDCYFGYFFLLFFWLSSLDLLTIFGFVFGLLFSFYVCVYYSFWLVVPIRFGYGRLKVRGWKKILHENGNQRKAGVEILISDKIDFKIKKITRDKYGHYIMIKGYIQEEDITIINIYAPDIGAPQNIRQLLTAIKGETNTTIRMGNFNTLLTLRDRSSRIWYQQGNTGLK